MAVLWLAPCIPAQVVTATLTGSVRDASGSAIAGAKIRVVNTATNLDRSTTADDSGNYILPALSPGEYQIEADHPGFKRSVLTGIVLQVSQQARIDIAMTVGQLSESVSVEARVPLVDTESPVIGGVINQSRIEGLPLNGRNFMELTLLSGGMNEGQGSNAKGGILNKGFAPSAAGMPATDNNYQLDGADNKEAFFNTFNLSPSVDAVREFRIQVGQYSAEFGAGGGAVINVVTKSGTNQFHGTAWEFLRNDIFDARNFFLPANQNIASLRQNQFGVAAGGPVIKDRTFLFGNFDLARIRRGSFRTAFVPSDALRSGDFSGSATTIIDPLTRMAFPNNRIPASRINPISAALLPYYPAPNGVSGTQNYINNLPSQDDQNNYLLRADHRLSDHHDLMFRYGSQGVERFTPGTYTSVGGIVQPQRFQGSVLGLTSSLSPTLLNEARFNYSRSINRTRGQNSGTPLAANAGVPFAPLSGLGAGFPTAITFSRTLVSNITETQPWFLTVNTFQWYDGITWVRNSHTLKFGADIRRNRSDATLFSNSNNVYNFTGQFTGEGFADFLLGYPGSETLSLKENDPARFRRTQQAYYVTDDWKAASNLTLTLGLRYEFNAIPKELKGLTPQFDPTLGNGQGGLRFPSQNKEAVSWFQANRPDLPVALLDRETLFRSDKNNFAPRLGFAWRPFGGESTVVRGGYGIYYSSAQVNNLVQNSVTGPPAQMWPTYSSDPATPTLGYGGLIGTSPDQALRTATYGLLTGPEDKFLDGYTQQWSLSVARTIGTTWVVEAQYMGSKGTHLENLLDYNTTTPGPGAVAARVPFPKWGRIAGFSSGAAANYNALLLNAEKRFSRGLQFKVNYTWSKNLTKLGGRIANGNVTNVQNPLNTRDENGRSTDDVPHRFNANYSYELPFGKGRLLGSNWNGVAQAVAGGWTIAGISTIRSGFYLRPLIAAANCNHSYFAACRPDVVGEHFLGGNGVDTPRWDRNAFDYPLNTTGGRPARPQKLGNAGNNVLQSNGLINFDMSLQKNFLVGDALRFEFRMESFNAFNHANFLDPNNNADSPLFGRVFTSASPRVNQLGLKMYW